MTIATKLPIIAEPRVELIRLEKIHESASNPRQSFDPVKLQELADDITRRGVLQPVLVRPRPSGGFELVFGARRYRAAKLAKLETLLCIVREMTDEQVLETQLVENAKRTDIHPLEEADALATLHGSHKLPIPEIAARLGRPEAYIRRRMKLCDLNEIGRRVFVEGLLTIGAAERLAIVAKSMQPKAMKAVQDALKHRVNDEPLSVFEANRIARQFMCRLDQAGFDLKDATLPGGACTPCSKRSGAQRELFDSGEERSEDLCLDPECFRYKREVIWDARSAAAKSKGVSVIPSADAKKMFSFGGRLESKEYVDLDEQTWVGDKQRTYRSILGKVEPAAIVRDSEGRLHELALRTDASKAASKAKGAVPQKDTSAQNRQDDKSRREHELKRTIERAMMCAAIARIESRDVPDAGWRALAHVLLEFSSADDVFTRRGWADEAEIAAKIDVLKGGELRGLVFELAITPHEAEKLVIALGLDPKKIAAAAKAPPKAPPKAKKAVKKPAAKKPAKARR
jgi:ParB/RepB/Spo0J family partition protein